MNIGYTTSSFPDHSAAAALGVLRSIGFQSVVARIGPSLNPLGNAAEFESQCAAIVAARGGATVLLDADAPFLLDPWHAERPSLVEADEADAGRRVDLIRRTIDAAQTLDNSAVILSSGKSNPHSDLERLLDQLAGRLNRIIRHAADAAVPLVLRPAKDHAVATVANFERLLQWIQSPQQLQLAGDLSLMIHQGELPAVPVLARHIERLRVVFMRFDGPLDHAAVMRGLQQAGFAGALVAGGCSAGEDPLGQARNAFEMLE